MPPLTSRCASGLGRCLPERLLVKQGVNEVSHSPKEASSFRHWFRFDEVEIV